MHTPRLTRHHSHGGQSHGFTLIELLVVVAIIALLISILIPALGRAREQSKSILCLANMRQLGIASHMYADDHHGELIPDSFDGSVWWGIILNEKYLCHMAMADSSNSAGILVCPKTEIPNNPKDDQLYVGDSNRTWTWHYHANSYGANLWLVARDFYWEWYFEEELEEGYFMETLDRIKWPSEVPVYADSIWWGGWPDDEDVPPADLTVGNMNHEKGRFMGRFCIDRHLRRINAVFADASARPVTLEGLWRIRWHNKFVANYDISIP